MNIAVIKSDIVASRSVQNPDTWLQPLKGLLHTFGTTPKEWEVAWGDAFQLMIHNPLQALRIAFQLKSLIKSIKVDQDQKTKSKIDIRIGIGIGQLHYEADRIGESNGSAFINAAEAFDYLPKNQSLIAVWSQDPRFNQEINLYLRLAATFMDSWSQSSAEVVYYSLQNPNLTQEELAKKLGISQSAISSRRSRAGLDQLLAIEETYQQRISSYL